MRELQQSADNKGGSARGPLWLEPYSGGFFNTRAAAPAGCPPSPSRDDSAAPAHAFRGSDRELPAPSEWDFAAFSRLGRSRGSNELRRGRLAVGAGIPAGRYRCAPTRKQQPPGRRLNA
jgi:hypothetical protein